MQIRFYCENVIVRFQSVGKRSGYKSDAHAAVNHIKQMTHVFNLVAALNAEIMHREKLLQIFPSADSVVEGYEVLNRNIVNSYVFADEGAVVFACDKNIAVIKKCSGDYVFGIGEGRERKNRVSLIINKC